MDQPTMNNPAPSSEPAPFEMPPDVKAPEPMGGGAPKQVPGLGQASPIVTNGPQETPPPSVMPNNKKPTRNCILMIVLATVLVVGMLLFASYMGWISLFGLNKDANTATSPSPSSTVTPKITTSTSPQSSSSPQVTTNVNDETRKKDIANIKAALKKYYTAKSEYPKSETITKISDPATALKVLLPDYLTVLPNDPQAPTFYYGYKSNGQTFELTAVLEDKSDTSGTVSGNYNVYKVTNLTVE